MASPATIPIPAGSTLEPIQQATSAPQSVPIPAGSTLEALPGAAPQIPEQTIGHAAKSFLGDLWDSAKGLVKTVAAPPSTDTEKAASVLFPGGGVPMLRVGKGYFDSVRHLLDQAEAAGEKGDTHGVMINTIAAGLPLVGPLAGDLYEQAKSGDTAGAIGKGLSRATQAATMAPKGSVIPNPAELVTRPLAAVVSKAREYGAAKAPEMYQEALKPSTSDPAKATRVVQNGLELEIPVSKGGLADLNQRLSDLNQKITQTIGDGQGKTINKFKVASRLNETVRDARNQVNPGDDVTAIKASGDEFLKGNPTEIPAKQAQAMKVGTYERLGSKAYGPNPELKAATVEAQKSLVRGLKDEIAVQFPELKNLNASESRLLDLQPVLEKAVTRIGNRSGIGIGSGIAAGGAKAITGSGGIAAVVGTMKAVFDNPSFKSRLAMALYQAGKKAGQPVTLPQATARVAAYVNALGAGASGSAEESQ